MRNKKFLAMASLLCTATLCVGAGAAVLGNDATTVNADSTTPVYTKTIDSVEYTFEQDFNALSYTGFGSIVNNYGMKTSVGATVWSHANNAGAYNPAHTVKSSDNTAFVSASNGVAFQFAITGKVAQQGRIELIYGNVGVNFTFFAGNRLKIGPISYYTDDSAPATRTSIAMTYSNTAGESYQYYNLYENCFTSDGNYNTMADGWMEIGMHKNKCTAIGGDETAATGYWLTLYVKTQSGETIVLHDGYEEKDMYTTAYDAVSLGFNAHTSSAPLVGTPFMKVRDCTSTLTVNANVATDVADWEGITTSLGGTNQGNDELYLKGVERTSDTYRKIDNGVMLQDNGNTQLSYGVEFRMTETTEKATLQTAIGTKTSLGYYISVWLGRNIVDIYPSVDLSAWNIRTLSANTDDNGFIVENTQVNVLDFEYGAEYAVKAMRLAVNPSAHDKTTGSVIRVYMAKVDETTGKPVDGWDTTPVYEHYTSSLRVTTSVSLHNWGVQPANNAVAHTTFIRSNKYVGVKTNVGEDTVLHKVPYGTDFALADLITGENTICAGWSKGATTYSADDYVAADTVFENMTESKLDNTYYALTMTLEADKAASLRIRKRGENPLEVSLNWAVTATDGNSIGAYFGGISFGYKLTASNNVSTEQEVLKYTDGYTTPYEYSITQSNITSDYYDMKFVCQAYVELNGVKYYTAELDMENDGRSVESVVNATLADVKDSAEGEYVNAVEVDGVTKYTYLTTAQYDFVKTYLTASNS